MSFGHSEYLQVYNRTSDPTEFTENGEIKIEENWYSFSNAGANPIKRAINLSKKYPNELFRFRKINGYTIHQHRDWYYKAGEMICYRYEDKNPEYKDGRHSVHDYYIWRGDALPEFPVLPLFAVNEVIFDEVERNMKFVPRINMSSVAAFEAIYIGKVGYAKQHQTIQADFPGKVRSIVNGVEVDDLVAWFDTKLNGANYRDSLILPRGSYLKDIHFTDGTFRTADPRNILKDFKALSELMTEVAIKSQNYTPLMQDYARLLAVAVTDMENYTNGTLGDQS